MTLFEALSVGVPALVTVVWVAVAVYRTGWRNLRRELSSGMEQDMWYDSEGNHIYYDRKYIRYRQQLKNRAASSQE